MPLPIHNISSHIKGPRVLHVCIQSTMEATQFYFPSMTIYVTLLYFFQGFPLKKTSLTVAAWTAIYSNYRMLMFLPTLHDCSEPPHASFTTGTNDPPCLNRATLGLWRPITLATTHHLARPNPSALHPVTFPLFSLLSIMSPLI